MSIWRLRRRKINNMGMSLVEIIVAMAVLMIVTVPILYTFVYTANFNARARQRQQTTAAAQTVMENLKAYSVEEICKNFNDKTFPVSGVGSSGFDELILSGVTFTPEGVPECDGGDILLQISGMVYQRQTYDVDIKLSGHSSDASNIDVLKYGNPTLENAASYVVSNSTMDSDALWEIMGIVAQKWNDEENAPGSLDPSATPAPTSAPVLHSAAEVDARKIVITKRELRVDIDQVGSEYVAKVSCVYTFKVNQHPCEGGDFSMPETEYQVDLSDSAGGADLSKEFFRQGTPLEYLYLYYYPAYSSILGSSGSGDPEVGQDKIIIDNTTGTEVACYIYKQKNLAISDTRLESAESTYVVKVDLTNAYIYDDNFKTILGGDGNTTIPNSNIKITPSDKRYKGIGHAAAMTEYPSTGTFSPGIPSDMPAATVEKNQRIMYNVEIILKDSETGRQLGILTGTIVE